MASGNDEDVEFENIYTWASEYFQTLLTQNHSRFNDNDGVGDWCI